MGRSVGCLVVGPGTVPDLVFHAGIYVVPFIGLIVAARSSRGDLDV